jgi:hypothetical protein
LTVKLTNGVPGDQPIQRATGCDARTPSTCTVVMNSDRSVTIAIGCEVSCGGESADPSLSDASAWASVTESWADAGTHL